MSEKKPVAPTSGELAERTDDALIWRYLDNELSAEEFTTFTARLNDANFQKRLAELATDHVSLHEMMSESSWLELAVEGEPIVSSHSPRRGGGELRRSRNLWSPAAISLSLLGGLIWWGLGYQVETPELQPVIGRIVALDGLTDAVANDGLEIGRLIRSGDTLQGEFDDGSVEVLLQDGSRLRLIGRTKITMSDLDGQKRLHTPTGSLWADVKPQPLGKPMVVTTSLAEMKVLGTELAIDAQAERTRLRVTQGQVRMKDIDEGREIDVNSDHMATVDASSELHSQRFIRPPSTWGEDFDQPLTTLWPSGTLLINQAVSNGVLSTSEEPSGRFMIRSPMDYLDGFFEITDETHLNLRLRMDNPGFYQIIIGTRSEDLKSNQGKNFEFQESGSTTRRYQSWQTVSIPLNEFRETLPRTPGRANIAFKRRPDVHPVVGDTVFFVFIGTHNVDRGFALDRIWVSRGPVTSTSL